MAAIGADARRDARHRARRDGRRPRARRDRRRRACGPRPSSTSTSCSPARPTSLAAHAARRCRAGGRHDAARAPRSSRWTTSPPTRSAPRRTRRSSAAPRPSATAGPTRWSAPATPARRWPPRCCAWAASAACNARRSPCRSPSRDATRRSILLDAGATVDPEPAWLVQWARLGREYAKVRLGIDEPTVALLSNGEEAGQGRRAAQAVVRAALADVKGFIGNVEGRDLLRGGADVDRHRRVHRQRRAEDARRRDARPRRARLLRRRRAGVGRRRRRAEAPPAGSGRTAACPTTRVARCCSASTASA